MICDLGTHLHAGVDYAETHIFVVVVTYNGRNDIVKCLSSLQSSTIPVRILVVDNKSTDETVEIIRRDFPLVDVMRSAENLGFGRGNNIGIKHAYDSGAEHIFLLNQDAFVEPNTIEILRDIQVANDDFVLLSPMQLDGTGRQLDTKFATHIAKSSSIGKMLSDSFLAKQLEALYEVDLFNAAAWMLSRKCIKQVGLFNPIFEHYGEDFEYVHRVQQKGFSAGLSTQTIAYHDRCQNQKERQMNWHKTFMMEKALIRYRLCRKKPGTATNIVSVVARALFTDNLNPLESILMRMKLLLFIILNLNKTLKTRGLAYTTICPFYDVTPAFMKDFTPEGGES